MMELTFHVRWVTTEWGGRGSFFSTVRSFCIAVGGTLRKRVRVSPTSTFEEGSTLTVPLKNCTAVGNKFVQEMVEGNLLLV
jgi:hypothetical protein